MSGKFYWKKINIYKTIKTECHVEYNVMKTRDTRNKSHFGILFLSHYCLGMRWLYVLHWITAIKLVHVVKLHSYSNYTKTCFTALDIQSVDLYTILLTVADKHSFEFTRNSAANVPDMFNWLCIHNMFCGSYISITTIYVY